MGGCRLTACNLRQCALGTFVVLASVGLVQSFRVHSELPETLENIAKGRPTIQSSSEHQYYTRSAFAVDGNGKKCAQTQWSSKPWWRVELGKEVWVEKVRIVNTKHKMSNLDIRIGSNTFSHGALNPLCRQGLMVPSEPCLYSCAEPMLGKFVYIGIQMKATLTLCEVEVFVNNEAKNADWKYLVPVSYGRLLQRASFVRSDQKYVYTSHGRVPWKEIIIDQPPKKGSLQFNDKVIMPVTYKFKRNNELIAICGPLRKETYFNATVISDQKTAGILVKALYKHPSGKPEYQKEEKYHCSWKDLRLKGRDVCKLEVSCPAFSRCNTAYISSSFPPASYYCICNPGYQPSVRRTGNFVLSHEKCVKQNTEPFIRHSKQNLALKMDTGASSTDNYNGCKYKSCRKRPGFSRLAVDGFFHSCFLSLTEHSPWFSVHLNRYHPIALIHVALGERDKRQPKKVFVGNTKAMKNQYSRCAGVETEYKLWSAECRSGQENYMWGNAVKITTDAKILHLCEVQVYAETYGNIALKHITLDAENSLKGSPTTDGILKGGPCLSRRQLYWWVAFGSPVRIAVVFVMHQENSPSAGFDITVDIGNGNYKRCASASGYKSSANYFQCMLPLLGNKVHIVSKEKGTYSFCEVEIFQTKTINFAARRPSSVSFGGNHKSKSKPELGCDQKIDVPVIARSDSGPWWSVDLLVTVNIHLIRIITDAGYDPKDLIHLQVLLDSSKLRHGNSPPGKVVFTLKRPTNDRVQNITLPQGTKGRTVSLRLPGRKELRFREVEVYNGHMLDVNECSVPDICPANFECKNTLDSYSCECRGGFKYEIKGKGKAKECVDIDECLVRRSCPRYHSYCKNTFGSYRCLCTKGYEGVYDANMQLNICKDIDECKNASLFSCPKRTRCVNTRGGYTCGCKPGYEPNPTIQNGRIKIQCKDVNECEKRTYSCHANASCTNTVGSYKCICFSGLKGDGRIHCTGLDLCTKDKKCSLEHQVCKKVKGLHVCDCTDGFYHSFRQCEDKNECELDRDICGLNSVCTNNKGSYRCRCKPGFKSASGDGKNCTDINECKESHPCGNQAKCENKPGTYKCVCRDGYAFHAEVKKCFDVNECEEKGKCGPNTKCHNAPGTYSCSCQKGFVTGKHKLNCTDVDECFNNNYDCDSRSYCVNIPGSYDCQCKEGYMKNVKNECEEECTEDCPLNSMCVNGRCYCLPGYVFGPYQECYKESFLLKHASGISLRCAVVLIMAALVGCLVLS